MEYISNFIRFKNSYKLIENNNDSYNNIKQNLIKKENNLIKREVDFLTTVSIVEKDIDKRMKDMKKLEQEFQNKLNKMNTVKNFQKIIKLNVGGTIYQTTIKTLTSDKNSLLYLMFNDKFNLLNDSNNNIFIDRDGDIFSYVLSYLRTGYIPQNISDDLKNRLKIEFEYFSININL